VFVFAQYGIECRLGDAALEVGIKQFIGEIDTGSVGQDITSVS
jgi:hypothetical protein